MPVPVSLPKNRTALAGRAADFSPRDCSYSPRDWAILAKHWYPVARSVDIQAQPLAVVLLDLHLVVYRTADGVHVGRERAAHRIFRQPVPPGAWVAERHPRDQPNLLVDIIYIVALCQKVEEGRPPMKMQLSSIEQTPVQVPIWHTMMDDLCQPPPARVAKVLGLGMRTVQRYNATGYAPRHVCLAIFWLTRWGRSAVNVQAENDARMLAGYVESLRGQVKGLETTVAHLGAIGHFGAANDPSQLVAPRLSAYEHLR